MTRASSRSADSSMVASSSSRRPRVHVDVALAQGGDRRLDRGQRRAQVVADGGEQRRALAVDRGELARARLRAEPAPLVGGLGRRGEGVQHALVLREQLRAAPEQPQPGTDRDIEAQRSFAPRGAQPARSASCHSPVSRSRAFRATDSMSNVRRAGQDAVQRRPPPRSVPASDKRVSASAAARSAARARRVASSTAR